VVQITKEMIIAMHEDLMRNGGQVQGILCEGTIDYIVEKINSVLEFMQIRLGIVYVLAASVF
jgi:hypothetical protein